MKALLGRALFVFFLASTGAAFSHAQSIPSGPSAAKIIFKASSPSGSFNPPTTASDGTVAAAGSGHQALRVFNADGSLLASGGPTASAWPKWLTGVEIGLTGSTTVTGGINQHCARFQDGTDATGCSYSGDGTLDDHDCRAPSGYYRISEFDCRDITASAEGALKAANGSGAGTDQVYIRATFSRDTAKLGATENIMVVVEYSATGLTRNASVASCLGGAGFNLTSAGCADLVWQTYLKHSAGEVVQPFMLLAPPIPNIVNSTLLLGGGNVTSRQFILPIAKDSELTVFQMSRVGSSLDPAVIDNTCGTDSAQCLGMVFYSMTFFRM